MKRLNSETGKPFERGDVRESGHVFWEYTKHVKRNGFFSEIWTLPERLPKKRSAKNYAIPAGRANTLLGGAKVRAKRKNLEFNLPANIIIEAIEKGYCELTGLKFDMNRVADTQVNPYSPSIDRKDSTKGYTKENVRIVLSSVNSALGEFGDKIMLPILKEMVKAIEKNAKQKTAAPVSEGTYIQGAVGAELGSVSTPWTWEDDNDTDHHSGADARKDADHRAQASSGDGVGRRGTEVVAPEPFTRIEDHGQPDAEIIRLDFGGRHIPDKP
jgi:hypothetical protein